MFPAGLGNRRWETDPGGPPSRCELYNHLIIHIKEEEEVGPPGGKGGHTRLPWLLLLLRWPFPWIILPTFNTLQYRGAGAK